MVNVFIIGSKGIPAKYGGFETFVDKLTLNTKSEDIKFHVACLNVDKDEFEYNNARCFNVRVRDVGSAKAILYDIKALKMCTGYIRERRLSKSIIYILASRMGPFLSIYKRKLKKLGIKVYINPDGHEWKRSKWNSLIKAYWKYSERLMVKYADLLICDSVGIENYIKKEYQKYNPKTKYIAYGADLVQSKREIDDSMFHEWLNIHDIKVKDYFLIVGRFVPENNYELIIREYMKSLTTKDLVIITNIENNKFYKHLIKNTKFFVNEKVKFVGTVYDQELLEKIRENAFGYIHGHEVGGTNPSLLEALACTSLNILLDVIFNKEVSQEGSLYFNKKPNDLSKIINIAEKMDIDDIDALSRIAKKRIINYYSWQKIVYEYQKIFLENHEK